MRQGIVREMIDAAGGINVVAERLGRSPNTVQHWWSKRYLPGTVDWDLRLLAGPEYCAIPAKRNPFAFPLCIHYHGETDTFCPEDAAEGSKFCRKHKADQR
ncbi:MAG: hypothetical protein VYB54_04780 [Pseudomonadota bacterium]|nr:hypothetical protein [Pseudomonadota bacterium]